MATQTVCFTIEGAAFTHLARTRLLEDNPGSAWRIASSLIGDGDSKNAVENAALAILKGDKKLIGDSTTTLELVDEDINVTAKFEEKVAWLYAGRIRYRDRWYRPIAKVVDYGIRDLVNDRGIEVRRIDGPNTGFHNREWHYCFRDEIAPLADSFDPDHNVIFEPCGELPHWIVPPSTPQAALKQWRAAERGLEERGHSMMYSDDASGTTTVGSALHGDIGADLTKEEQRIRDELKRQERDKREREEDAENEREDRAWEARIAQLREKILAQAGDDLIELSWPEETRTPEEQESDKAWDRDWKPEPGGTVMVPRAPFLHWAFDRMSRFQTHKPAWQLVSPSGLKMQGDNRYHTDWVIAAGFDPRDRRLYQGPINEAAMHLAWQQQERFSRVTGVHVLVAGATAHGTVVHGKANVPSPPGSIVVLPNLHPRYLAAVKDAAAVITEEGGETAHLAQVGLERALPMVRVQGAREKYPVGTKLIVDTQNRHVEEIEES